MTFVYYYIIIIFQWRIVTQPLHFTFQKRPYQNLRMKQNK